MNTINLSDNSVVMEPMKLEIKTLSKKKLNEPSEAYSLFIDNWDEDRLESIKEAKAIFMNEKDEAFAICDIPADRQDVSLEKRLNVKYKINPVLKEAKKAKATSIIIAESRFADDIFADPHRKKIVDEFVKTAVNYNLRIEDYISMNGISCSSFRMQKLL